MHQAAIKDFRETFSGEVILPGDERYDEASKILIRKGTPALVVQPLTADDIAQAIAFAKDNALTLSVRSGGHSQAGYSTNDGGMIIDVRDMRSIEIVDEPKHLVRVGSGANWGDIAAELGRHGLALSSGDTKTVGAGGLAMGGGIGWMVRKYGLTIDSMVAVDIVTAAGELVHASETEHSDLFWAVRGGGGNFGVAVSFTFAAHPVGQVYTGTITYAFDTLNEVLKGWRDYMRTAPDELTAMVNIIPTTPMFGNLPAMALLTVCYCGEDRSEGEAVVASLLQLGKVVSQDLKWDAYANVLEEAHAPDGVKIVVRNGFIKELTDELIDIITTHENIYQVRSIGGAMNRVPADATAFAHRDSEAFMVMPFIFPQDVADAEVDKALGLWRAIQPHTNGAYVNFISEWTDEARAAAYPDATYNRLLQVKKQYDPQNVFNQNYNIS
jgi:FAD/FMN-containing dehydrogenase